MMLRLVLDTDVIVAALRSPQGASAALVKAARYKRVQLLASTAMMMEYEAVCTRKEHLSGANLTRPEVQTYLDVLCSLTDYVEPHYSWRPQLTDANDEMVLETAINGQAHGIVTFNLKDYGTSSERFGVSLWLPKQAIRRIQS